MAEASKQMALMELRNMVQLIDLTRARQHMDILPCQDDTKQEETTHDQYATLVMAKKKQLTDVSDIFSNGAKSLKRKSVESKNFATDLEQLARNGGYPQL
eukprot:TRINITY_DN1296_c0_g1_i4.p1 TRINITY_DN1296_c0_g1~~TRINITY_DN1296_c0_g1_i4.p1  ORF type:complete len:116 (+),score=19.16 TRINITY_DN1296_c0_g1_i4:49-348(+)